MPPVSPDRKLHLLVHGTAEAGKYKYPKEVRGAGKVKLPGRVRGPHGAQLQNDLATVQTSLPTLSLERQAAGVLRVGEDRNKLYDDFRAFGEKHGLKVGKTKLEFPDRTVCLAFGTSEHISSSVQLLDCVAELRRAKELASFFTSMPPSEQAEWSEAMADHVEAPTANAPAVCILDSGVTRGHPLIKPALNEEDMHTFDDAWGTGDSARWGGHGTSMSGLALHGDLTNALSSTGTIGVEHRLESVKILPPGGFPENKPKLYGAIAEYAVALPEISEPQRRRAFVLAVTALDARDQGSPSSWSAKVDALAFGDEGEGQRLMLVSAGNLDDPAAWKEYPNSNDLEQVHDPGQAWNALTVGGCRDKVMIDTGTFPSWLPVAPSGGLSPTSSTSLAWKTPWPNKPDIVFEAGNAARNPATGDVDQIDDLALLTTHWRPTEKLFVPTGDTSAAVAQAARLAAILMARYPNYWPETIRALLVHSAGWTSGMLYQAASPSPSQRLRVLCG